MRSKLDSVRNIDEFTEEQVRYVDAYLAAERAEDLRQAGIDVAWEEEGWTDATRADYESWSREVDAEFEHLCRVHGDEVDEQGLCPQCRQEIAQERIDDK